MNIKKMTKKIVPRNANISECLHLTLLLCLHHSCNEERSSNIHILGIYCSILIHSPNSWLISQIKLSQLFWLILLITYSQDLLSSFFGGSFVSRTCLIMSSIFSSWGTRDTIRELLFSSFTITSLASINLAGEALNNFLLISFVFLEISCSVLVNKSCFSFSTISSLFCKFWSWNNKICRNLLIEG